MTLISLLLRGAAAGAAGTTALNAVTYLDMGIRGRPSSSTPERTVERVSGLAHVRVPGTGEQRANRLTGLGALSGIATGIGVGMAYGGARALGWRPSVLAGSIALGAGALLGSNGPMTLLGITDPRQWSAADWVSDLVPHAAYGAVAALTFDL